VPVSPAHQCRYRLGVLFRNVCREILARAAAGYNTNNQRSLLNRRRQMLDASLERLVVRFAKRRRSRGRVDIDQRLTQRRSICRPGVVGLPFLYGQKYRGLLRRNALPFPCNHTRAIFQQFKPPSAWSAPLKLWLTEDHRRSLR
jgi:hypothetical protein